MKSGAADDSLFSKPPYAKGDKYIQPGSKLARGEKNGFLKGGHDMDFRPAKICNLEKVPKPAYKYIPQGVDKKKSFKDPEGGVIIGPRNFTTKPLKKGKTG